MPLFVWSINILVRHCFIFDLLNRSFPLTKHLQLEWWEFLEDKNRGRVSAGEQTRHVESQLVPSYEVQGGKTDVGPRNSSAIKTCLVLRTHLEENVWGICRDVHLTPTAFYLSEPRELVREHINKVKSNPGSCLNYWPSYGFGELPYSHSTEVWGELLVSLRLKHSYILVFFIFVFI